MRIAAILVCLALTGQLMDAQENPWRHWYLSRLQPGRQVTVQAVNPERTLKGVFAGRDADAITITLKSGSIETIARQDVRKLTARREGYRAPLIGAAVGGGISAVAVGANKGRLDLNGKSVAVLSLFFAGIGVAVGFVVRAAGRNEVIYQAPPR
jgi:hypothetical protein